jgi:hypothetical protein
MILTKSEDVRDHREESYFDTKRREQLEYLEAQPVQPEPIQIANATPDISSLSELPLAGTASTSMQLDNTYQKLAWMKEVNNVSYPF